jgi:thiol-disulfide isomerase/thioredoxin
MICLLNFSGFSLNSTLGTTIAGSILAYKGKPLIVTIKFYDQNDLTNNSNWEKKIKIGNTGGFKVNLSLDHPVYISLHFNIGKKFVYVFSSNKMYDFPERLIEPGDSIYLEIQNLLTVKMNNGSYFLKHIVYSGRGVEKFTCLQEMYRQMNRIGTRTLEENYNDVLARLAYDDSLKLIALTMLNKYKFQLTKLNRDVILGNLLGLTTYFNLKYISTNPEISDSTRLIFQQKLATDPDCPDFSDSNFHYSPAHLFGWYARFREIFKYCNKKQIIYKGSYFGIPSQVATARILNNMRKGLLRSKVIAAFLIAEINRSGVTDTLTEQIREFEEDPTQDKRYQLQVETVFKKLSSSDLLSGGKAFNFSLPDTNGNIIKMQDFQGKVVLLDFMFTWCPGCRSLTPYLAKVEKEFKGNPNIVFISISTDKDIKIVKEGIGKASVRGSIQLFTNGEGVDHQIIRHYSISAYPTLILIDKNGRLVSTRVPDPRLDNGKKLMDTILSLL